MNIKSNIKNYELRICEDFSFIADLKNLENAFFVIDKAVYDLYRNQLFSDFSQDRLRIIEAVETHKVIETSLSICEAMTDIPAKRNATLVSIGGGIIQDITGFAANILYRGINWIFVPTTLLASCDSAIGSKTSLNYKRYKNLLGTFYPPDTIYLCPKFFETLIENDYLSGLGELFRYTAMLGHEGIGSIEENIDYLIARDKKTIAQFIDKSLLIKKEYIEEDEFERGIRIRLNYAHTYAHAFETVSDYAIPHGTAVAMGVIAANNVSLQKGLVTKGFTDKIEDVFLKIIKVEDQHLNFDMNKIIAAMRKDKKQTDNSITVVLLDEEGKLDIYKNITEKQVEESVKYLVSLLK